MKKNIELVWIVVADFKKALQFYTEIVGLTIQNSNEEFGWAELKGKEGAILGIAQASAECPIAPGSNAVVTFTVDDIQKAIEELRTKDIELVGDIQEVPGHVKLQLFKDKDNNHFQYAECLDSL
jgi:predicted enzyme related to lactoylglutathione lyase